MSRDNSTWKRCWEEVEALPLELLVRYRTGTCTFLYKRRKKVADCWFFLRSEEVGSSDSWCLLSFALAASVTRQYLLKSVFLGVAAPQILLTLRNLQLFPHQWKLNGYAMGVLYVTAPTQRPPEECSPLKLLAYSRH